MPQHIEYNFFPPQNLNILIKIFSGMCSTFNPFHIIFTLSVYTYRKYLFFTNKAMQLLTFTQTFNETSS